VVGRGNFHDSLMRLVFCIDMRGVGFRNSAICLVRFSSSLRDSLLAAGCSSKEADGWAKEMNGWSDHSVQVSLSKMLGCCVSQENRFSKKKAFLVKLTQMNSARPPAVEMAPAASSSSRSFVNPVTGEIGGPEGPEPTRFNDWSYKGRCTDF
jgi:hypothetical protein